MTPKAPETGIAVTITPAGVGRDLVRVSLPFPSGLVKPGQALIADDGREKTLAALRPLTWHPGGTRSTRSVRRALVTFPYDFAGPSPVRFNLRPAAAGRTTDARWPVTVSADDETVRVIYADGLVLTARLIGPPRAAPAPSWVETVESNAYFNWRRVHLPDRDWPRVIEIRVDARGRVVLVAHLQRNLAGDGRAPDFGWEMETRLSPCRLQTGNTELPVGGDGPSHSFADGQPCAILFEGGRYSIYHPAAPFKRRGRVEVRPEAGSNLLYRYWRCTAPEKAPMQQAAWERAEMVVSPSGLAPLTATLESPHSVELDWRLWDVLYGTGPPLDLTHEPELDRLLRYHHDAIVASAAPGDDWGNVTAYTDGNSSGAVFGMNRLNHCAAIYEEGLRRGDRRLTDVAVAWCDNFYDRSIWWGPEQTGGTRYNNMIAQGQTPPDNDQSYMWRSNRAVNFCTKGFDAFFLAYEQTGDPRMLEALNAQLRYAAQYIHADQGECRNVGAAEDFMRLYEFTGDEKFLKEARRLFRELRTKLSSGDLFSQGGQPLEPDPPFIEDDPGGSRHPFAKPYIIGYALAGLPDLARYAPEELKLRDVVQAVADFLADSQDPVGGWRYPHPRSSYVILSQAMEHAWQIVQADKFLGAQERHLDAVERVLRQRLLGWRKTGHIFSGLTGWEMATGKVTQSRELYQLYKLPIDRDPAPDYAAGRPDFGSSGPEGLVYFPEVLAFYLQHRPASRLLAPATADAPLGQVLARVPETGR